MRKVIPPLGIRTIPVKTRHCMSPPPRDTCQRTGLAMSTNEKTERNYDENDMNID